MLVDAMVSVFSVVEMLVPVWCCAAVGSNSSAGITVPATAPVVPSSLAKVSATNFGVVAGEGPPSLGRLPME